MAFTICVKIGLLPDGYEPIIKHYNDNRPEGTQKLEILDRMEGGFKIKFDDYDRINSIEENDKIYQLRWNKRKLISGSYYGFNKEQLELLYAALAYSLGSDKVYKEEANNQADGLCNRTHVQIINGEHIVRSRY